MTCRLLLVCIAIVTLFARQSHTFGSRCHVVGASSMQRENDVNRQHLHRTRCRPAQKPEQSDTDRNEHRNIRQLRRIGGDKTIQNRSNASHSLIVMPDYVMPVKRRHAKRHNRNFVWRSNENGRYIHKMSTGRQSHVDRQMTSNQFIDMEHYVSSSTTATAATEDDPTSTIHWPVKKEAIMEGNLILGGLMMVHSREDTITCGPIMPQGGIQALEAMLYTLDRINADKILLPNITIGAHILDDCDKDTYGLEMAVDFIKGTCVASSKQTNEIERRGRR